MPRSSTACRARTTAADVELLKSCAAEALAARGQIRRVKRRLAALVEKDAVLRKHVAIVGAATACVLRVAVGDPRDYRCGEAYRKAMGLNLKERSSGRHQGQLKITKRASSLARRWLYFAALRLVQRPPVRGWYQAKRAKDKGRGNGGAVAVMRKLALALYAVVVHDENFALVRLIAYSQLRELRELTYGSGGSDSSRSTGGTSTPLRESQARKRAACSRLADFRSANHCNRDALSLANSRCLGILSRMSSHSLNSVSSPA
jgi:hypothetical protein